MYLPLWSEQKQLQVGLSIVGNQPAGQPMLLQTFWHSGLALGDPRGSKAFGGPSATTSTGRLSLLSRGYCSSRCHGSGSFSSCCFGFSSSFPSSCLRGKAFGYSCSLTFASFLAFP